jgi:glycosyltransferase involved in cell wall biosynthesis
MSEEPGVPEAGGLPLVSIGIPVYNGANHLAGAIQSVLSQDYTNLEVVVCDNASDDGTPAIASDFAGRDPRVRYLRNPKNIGLLPNFRRVRDEARGKYFCWLGHDDLLSDPSYLSAAVDHLEAHPDVALCHTDICLLKTGGETEVVQFPELSPERSWAQVRRDLFRWPQDWLEMASHGVFRREELLKIPLPGNTRARLRHVFCWEIKMLTALSTRGRIVALPRALRTYRSSPESAARQMGRSVSPFVLLLIDMETKFTLLVRAVRSPGSVPERVRLGATALGNFSRKTFRRRFDHRTAMRMADDELTMLLATARDRAKLVLQLQGEIEDRSKLLAERGEAPEPFTPIQTEPLPPSGPAVKPTRGKLRDFFRPASPAQIRWYAEVNYRITALRRYCERQLQEIDRSDAEAARLLTRL